VVSSSGTILFFCVGPSVLLEHFVVTGDTKSSRTHEKSAMSFSKKVNSELSCVAKRLNEIVSQAVPRSNASVKDFKTIFDMVNPCLPKQQQVECNLMNHDHPAIHVNVGCFTRIIHNEWDMNHTTIVRPLQQERENLNKLEFVFKTSNKIEMTVPMNNKVALFCNAHFLAHQQRLNDSDGHVPPLNLSSYSPRRLGNNTFKTVERMIVKVLNTKEVKELKLN